MRKTTIPGRLIKDLVGLKAALLAGGFQVEQIYADANGGQPYTCVCLADADEKRPTALVQGFVDNPPQGSAHTMLAPDGSKWMIRVGNDGTLTTTKLT
jgi:hypothetical protein